MRRLTTLSVLVLSLSSLSYVHSQDVENVYYEKLKVLEPIIGTWRSTKTNEQTNKQVETVTTYSWLSNKKMIVATSKLRRADIGEDISKQEWTDLGPRVNFVWNRKSECIEQYFFFYWGPVIASKVTPQGEGRFELDVFHSTFPDAADSDSDTDVVNVMTITEDELRIRTTNIKGPEGQPLEDWEWHTFKRDKPTDE